MRKLQRLTVAVVLAIVFTPSALAGITDTPPVAPPDPPSATATAPTDQNNQEISVAPIDPLTDVALSLLQSALSMF